MKKLNVILLLLGAALLLTTKSWAETATAVIKGTTPDSKISGTITLTEEKGGLTVVAHVANVPPGSHGFHIHAVGNCSDKGMAAGGHFNPDKSPHGLYPMDGPMKSMAGDMGNIVVHPDGSGDFSVFMPALTLHDGKYAVNGLSVVLHEKIDDFSQPSGNAGGRIGCGIITTSTAAAAAKPAASAQK